MSLLWIIILISITHFIKCGLMERQISVLPAYVISNIRNNFPECQQLDLLHESSFLLNENSCPENRVTSSEIHRGAHVILNLKNSNVTLSERPSLGFSTRFNVRCWLTFYKLDRAELSAINTTDEGAQRFQFRREHLLDKIRNPCKTFLVFFLTDAIEPDEALEIFIKETSVIRYCAIVRGRDDRIILTKYLVVKKLKKEDEISDVDGFNMFSNQKEDFSGGTILVLTCPTCQEAYEDFLREGIWSNYVMASIYEVAKKFNVSIEDQAVFGMPQGELKEDGEWDDFTKPLIDGSAAISTMIKPTAVNFRVIYHSMPYLYDHVTFITGPPKRAKFSYISALKEPLDNQVWLGILFSITLIFASIQLFARYRRTSFSKLKLLAVILKPALDQNSGGSLDKLRDLENNSGVIRLNIGLWLLSLIVLGCAYRCMLLSIIVIPKFIYPPRTFEELVQSTYDLNILYYTGVLDSELIAANNSVSRGIMARAVELDYIEPECYQLIFEAKTVCMGYNMFFDAVGIEFMVDTRGRKLWTRSRDSHYFGLMGMGISKYYPMFVGKGDDWLYLQELRTITEIMQPLNSMMNIMDSMGLLQLYWSRNQKNTLKKGQVYAKKMMTRKPYYKGDSDVNESNEIQQILLRIYMYGALASILVLGGEYAWDRFSRTILQVEVTHMNVTSYGMMTDLL